MQKGPQSKGIYCFGYITQELADAIFYVTGENLYNYRITVDNSAIRHILEHHTGTTEIKRGQIPVVVDDFVDLKDKILAPSKVYDGGQKKGQLASVNFVVVSDLVETVLVFTIHPGKRRQYLAVKTMYKRKGQPQ